MNADKIETLTVFFNWVDTDHDGFISIDEIKEACAVDIDGDGTITDAEKIQCAQQWITMNLPLQDANGDQLISLAELLAFNA
jgi:Ca2+-binding EF-hand superfamily protein